MAEKVMTKDMVARAKKANNDFVTVEHVHDQALKAQGGGADEDGGDSGDSGDEGGDEGGGERGNEGEDEGGDEEGGGVEGGGGDAGDEDGESPVPPHATLSEEHKRRREVALRTLIPP